MARINDPHTLIERLKRRGFEQIGAGAYSTVLAKPGSNKVIKVSRCMDDWIDYVLWASRKGYAGAIAPRVYSFRKNTRFYVAVVERMAETLAAIRETKPVKYDAWENLCSSRYSNNPETSLADKHWPGGVTFLNELAGEFGNYLDLHSHNWMVRPDGSLCCTDPLASDERRSTPDRMRSRDFASLAAA